MGRPANALKNLLLLPGVGLGWVLSKEPSTWQLLFEHTAHVALTFIACCLVASWNYTLNDFCDRDGDRWHPEKSKRVSGEPRAEKFKLVATACVLAFATVALAWPGGLGQWIAILLGLFALSGAAYNIPPILLKRIPFLDEMAEAVNFPIRLALGWYAVLPNGPLPPLSAMLAFWALGGVLLTGKRAAELAHHPPFPFLRSGHRLIQRPSRKKQIPCNHKDPRRC